MKKTILIFFAFITTSVIAQTDGKTFLKEKLSYFGAYSGNNIVNPGINIGANYNLYLKEKQKQKKEKKKTITRELNLDGNIGFFWDPMNHCGVYTNYGISYIKTKTRGFQFYAGLNPLGYYRSFLPETYEVDENWEVNKVFMPGRSYFAPSINLGIGHTRPDKFLNAWFLKLKTIILTPYNGHSMPLLFIDYGYHFNLK